MSVASDSTLSAAAQQRIKEITQAAVNGTTSWAAANAAANAVRSSAGANYSATASGKTVSNGSNTSSGGNSSITADSGLTTEQLAKIQSYRDLANKGVISWDDANTAANSVRMSAGGYTVDKTGAATMYQPQQIEYPSFEQYLAGSGYDQYSEATKAAIQASVDSAVSGYQNQIETTNKDSAELARQAYIAKMLGQKNLDQQLSASGYSGGMADSQKIQTETNYQNNLTSIENQRQATVNQLQTAITQAKASGDQQTAEQLASYLQNLQSGWSSYVNNQNSLNASQAQFNTSQAADAKSTAYTQAMNTLSAGVMPDSATLTAAGINSTTAALIRNYYMNQISLANQQASLENQKLQSSLTASKSGTAKSSGSGSGYNNGKLTTDQVKQIQRYIGVTADGFWGNTSSAAADGMTADEAWKAYQTVNGKTISDYSQLGTAAKELFSNIQRNSARTGATKSDNKYLDLVETALQKGTVTEAEAEFILDKLGV